MAQQNYIYLDDEYGTSAQEFIELVEAITHGPICSACQQRHRRIGEHVAPCSAVMAD